MSGQRVACTRNGRWIFRGLAFAFKPLRRIFPALCPACGRIETISLCCLPSTASAENTSSGNEAGTLFGGFFGTMGASDFSPAWMAGLRFSCPYRPYPVGSRPVCAGAQESRIMSL